MESDLGRWIIKKDIIGNGIFNIYVGITCFFYSAIFAGSVLGFIGLYKPIYVFSLVFILTLLLFIVLSRTNAAAGRQIPQRKNTNKRALSEYVVYAVAILIIVLFILIPIVRWPESIAGDWFSWDAGKYHFPKAVEMYRSGSANDMTISYGEYPFGYESLLSFCLLVSGDATLFGWMHALINLFFILSLWLLAKRYTKIKSSFLLLLIALVILSNFFYQFLNIWQIFQSEVYTVGKNDLLLAASILSILFFYPYPKTGGFDMRAMLPTGIAGMIAVSVKPNAVYIMAPLWIFLGGKIIWEVIKNWGKESRTHLLFYLISSSLMVPGVIWLLRNMILNGQVFSDSILEASKWSIASNLTNPLFYEYVPKTLYIIIGLSLMMVLGSIKKFPQYRWQAGTLLLLATGFVFTPFSAFFPRADAPALINWRFGQAMLAYVFIIVLLLVGDFLGKINFSSKIKKIAGHLYLPFLLLIAGGVIWRLSPVLERKPENAIILRDQFRESIGVDGYHSAYDYVQKNVRDSTVWVENGLPYYVYGAGYTNTVSREHSADYVVVIKTDWFGGGGEYGGMEIPTYFDPEEWQKYYSVVYEDSQGIVFARKIK